METKSKHTPGPWKIRYYRAEIPEMGFFIEAKNNNKPELGYGIEIMQEDFGEHNGYPLKQRIADAKLIAAAPELLERLDLSTKVIRLLVAGKPVKNLDEIISQNDHLIKKATE